MGLWESVHTDHSMSHLLFISGVIYIFFFVEEKQLNLRIQIGKGLLAVGLFV